MAKKTKTGQQRVKEEQWRKRMTTQAGRTPGSAVMDVEDVEAGVQPDLPVGQTTYTASAAPVAPAPIPRPTTLPSSSAAQRTQSAATAAAQRRAQSATRTARTRLTTSTMSIDEEMHYVRSDIRMLILLTIVCVVIIVALSFVIK